MTESYSHVKVGPSVEEIALPIAEKIGDKMPQTVWIAELIPFQTVTTVVHRPWKARPIEPEITVTSRSKSGYRTLSHTAMMNVDTFVQTGSTTSCQKLHSAGIRVSRKKAASACSAG